MCKHVCMRALVWVYACGLVIVVCVCRDPKKEIFTSSYILVNQGTIGRIRWVGQDKRKRETLRYIRGQ